MLPSTAWHPRVRGRQQRRLHRPVRRQGQRRGAARLRRDATRATCCSARPTGRSSRAREAGRDRQLRPRPRRALVDLNLDGLLDLVEVNSARRTSRCGATSAPAPPSTRHRWATGSRVRAAAKPAPNRDAIGAWVEVKAGDRRSQRELTVGGGHASGQLGWMHFGLGRRGPSRGPGHVAGRRDRGRGCRCDADQFDDRARERRSRPVAADAARAIDRDATAAGSPRSSCPTSACPTTEPELPRVALRRPARTPARRATDARLRPPRRLRRPRAQREPRRT